MGDVIEAMEDLLSSKDLEGVKILITAGPTQEPIDPVRFITNRSTGKMGYALAEVASRRGAQVVLVAGPTVLDAKGKRIRTVQVRTAEEMKEAVLAHMDGCAAVIKAAAVSDYRPKSVSPQKIKKTDPHSSLELERTSDILAEVGRRKGNRILVGFAAETQELVNNAARKLTDKNLDFIVINDVTQPDAGFAVDTNQVKLLYPSGELKEIPLMSKQAVSEIILDEVAGLIRKRKGREAGS